MNKKDSSMLLFEEIGQIDEDILRECSDLYPIRRRRKRSLTAVIIAAAALTTLFSVLVVSAFAVMLRRGFAGQMTPGEHDQPGYAPEAPAEFAEHWEELTEEETHDRIFGQTPAVVVKKQGENTYRFACLSSVQYDRILKNVPEGYASESACEWQLWITDGKGRVFTPYLQSSPGNIHYGTLFEYDAEVDPGDGIYNALPD